MRIHALLRDDSYFVRGLFADELRGLSESAHPVTAAQWRKQLDLVTRLESDGDAPEVFAMATDSVHLFPPGAGRHGADRSRLVRLCAVQGRPARDALSHLVVRRGPSEDSRDETGDRGRGGRSHPDGTAGGS